MRALADAVRRLVLLTHTNGAPPEVLARVAADLNSASDRLEEHLSDEPVTHSMAAETAKGPGLDELAARMPFDPIIGPFNPLALPIKISSDGNKATGRGRFTLPYEGPPGCVHGAVIAATFDIVFTAANLIADAAGPTVSLTIRYKKPTLLHEEAAFEAEVSRRVGRRTFSTGRVVQNGAVTVEAEGEFAVLDRRVTRQLGASSRSTR